MRQGNGSEILGANDPRSADIGIIYVASTDDREGVLAAILTQERLGRKKVAIVLPDQNKAFQHPIDFDGLKNMRRKLQAQIVFVAPAGPGPAELARQRRFPVYSSLEFFAQSLQEDAAHASSANGNGDKAGGWLFGRKQKSPAAAPDLAQPVPVPPPSKTVLSPMGNGALAYAATAPDPPYDAPLNGSDSGNHPDGNGRAMGTMDAMAMSPIADETLVDSPDDEDEEADEFGVPLPPIIPLPLQVNDALPAPSNGAAVGNHSDRANNGNGAGPSIIELSPKRSGNTGKLAVPAAQADPQPNNLSTKRRTTGKIAPVVGVAGTVGVAGVAGAMEAASVGSAGSGTAAANGASAGAGSGMSPVSMAQTAQGGTGGGSMPPHGGTGGSGGPGGPSRSGAVPRWLMAVALVVLTLLLVFGGIAYAAPGVLKNFGGLVPGVSASPAATITIVPTTKVIKNTYVITAVTGKPDATQRQVQARNLSSTSPSQSKTANATGVANIPGKAATGTLTFFNGSSSTFTVAANTVLTASGGIPVENTVPAVIPAGSPTTGFGRVTVAARAVNIGSGGNIRAGAVSGNCCTSGNFITVTNQNSFTGGQDQAHYTFVQQSDIDGAANPLEQQLQTSTLANVKGQKKAGEQYVNGSNPIQCTPKVTSNHKAGDRASNVTVTVSVACSGEVYDQQGAQAMAVNLYKNDSTINPGAGFALTGNVSTTVGSPTAVDNKGTISLQVTAQGTWVFQISSALEKTWAKQIAGKSKQSATAYLQAQPGISKVVSIQLSTGNTLPTDPNQITFVIQNVTGGPGTPTPGSTPSGGQPTATPTPVNGLGGR